MSDLMKCHINKKCIVACIFLLLILPIVTAHFYWLDGIGGALKEIIFGQTIYSPGYSEYKFRSVKVGVTEKEVLRILGEPLSRKPHVWRYSFCKVLTSKGGSDGCYSVRYLEIENGVVVGKMHQFWFD